MLFYGKTHHAIIILWVRQTPRHAIIILWLWGCEFDRHIGMISSCDHEWHMHAIIRLCLAHYDDSSSCEFMAPKWRFGRLNKPNRPERIFEALFKGCECSIWAKKRWKVRRKDVTDGSFAIIRLCPDHYDDSSSCEFDIHIGMLSSSCVLDWHFYSDTLACYHHLWVRHAYRLSQWDVD